MDPRDTSKRKFFRGNTWIGLLFLAVGVALLLRQFGYAFPPWVLSWPMLLVVIGFLTGLRHGFRDFSWLIMMLVGGAFLFDLIYPDLHLRRYAFPGIIILLGLLFILAPRGKRFYRLHERLGRCRNTMRDYDYTNAQAADRPEGASPIQSAADPASEYTDSKIDIVCVCSGVKKKILSKNFRGGDVVCIFGGSEVNLTNADFVSPVTIEFVQIFGGTKLTVPANWEVRSEVTAIFGGVEDKRPQSTSSVPERTIILDGTVIFGGVEVNSF